MFKKSLIATALLAGLVAPAAAADLFIPQVVIQPELFSWSSCYVGVGIEYTTGETTSEFPFSDYFTEPSGPGLSPRAGCDWQMPDSPVVLGVVTDLTIRSVEDTRDVNLGPPLQTLTTSMPWAGTIRARAGIAADTTLFYVTGGLAVANIEQSLVVGGAPAITAENTQWGWTVGGGVEMMVTDNIALFAEYLYTDLGEEDYTFTGADFDGAGLDTLPFSSTNHTIKVGVNYRF